MMNTRRSILHSVTNIFENVADSKHTKKSHMEDFAMDRFILKAPYKPTGDQPQAIEQLVKGFKEGNQCQTLLGVTGSGKLLRWQM